MLQIVLQVLIEELEVSLPAVHPNDATVREKNRERDLRILKAYHVLS
jgi:hypothetical protein